ncbi:MAG: hypothetical protein JWN32_2373 [Solirubrobacterales bacterium]|nr:hypothetical protein [Solirubrobacterales bacterium]
MTAADGRVGGARVATRDGGHYREAMALGPLKRLPVVRLLAIGQIALLLREHVQKLTPAERRRLVELERKAKGRPKNLKPREREELRSIVAKLEPKAFAVNAARKVSPIARRRKK